MDTVQVGDKIGNARVKEVESTVIYEIESNKSIDTTWNNKIHL